MCGGEGEGDGEGEGEGELGVEGEDEGVWVYVGLSVSTGEGGGGGIFVGKFGADFGGLVVEICVGVRVGVGMRVPVVRGTSVGQLVPFCEVNVASGITVMAISGGFWVLVFWSSYTPPWTEMSLDPVRPRSARRST